MMQMGAKRSSPPGHGDQGPPIGDVRTLLEHAGSRCGFSSHDRYRRRAESLFAGVNLRGATVLDVGCGSGAWSLWCALNGAASVLGLEPEGDGSSPGVHRVCDDLIRECGVGATMSVSAETLAALLSSAHRRFSVCVMHNVINHLDEDAVVRLGRSRAADERYERVFRDLAGIVESGGWVILADCGRRNLWGDLGLRSPFDRAIEWEKHQEPDLWTALARRCGFEAVDLKWAYKYPLRRLTANRLANYLTTSDFVLRLRRR